MNKRIMIFIISFAIGIIMCTMLYSHTMISEAVPKYPDGTPSTNDGVKSTSLSIIESKTREATVKIITPSGGHGSGALYYYAGKFIALTAAHVTSELGVYTLIDRWGEERFATVIYVDSKYDFSILSTTSFTKTTPLQLKIPLYDIRNIVDKTLLFSGYPSSLPLLTTRGRVSGFRDDAIIMHSAAWMGSSGSNVFDNSGNFIGILYAVSVGDFIGIPTLMEDVIWVTPYYLLDWDLIRKSIKTRGRNGLKEETNPSIR